MQTVRMFVLASLLVCASIVASAQGNLQFDSADILEIYQAPNNNIYEKTDLTVTVPAGQVWKVENAALSRIFRSTSGGTPYSQARSEGVLMLNQTVIVEPTADYQVQVFPIWLPSGTYTFTLEGTTFQDDRYEDRALISLLKFNVN